jgi:hypothetical protein
VGGSGCDERGEVEDVLSAIASDGDGSGAFVSTWGRQQRQSPKPPPPPLPAFWASLARDAMARLLLSSSPSLMVGVSTNIN